MRLKLYRAPGMSQAMARMRAELGEDALILATRRVGDGVKITAALEPDEPPPADPALLAALEYHGLPSSFRPADLTFAHLPLEDQPLLFVGPPGAGKTLTVARPATRLVMAGTKPIVITADGKRAGATEEPAAFTKLLGNNLVVACHPVTLGRALTHRSAATPTLIDTPPVPIRSIPPSSRNCLPSPPPPMLPWCLCCPPAWTPPRPPTSLRPSLASERACWSPPAWTSRTAWAAFSPLPGWAWR